MQQIEGYSCPGLEQGHNNQANERRCPHAAVKSEAVLRDPVRHRPGGIGPAPGHPEHPEEKGGTTYGEIHSLRKAFQKGKAKAGSGQAADLGRTEPRHQKARKQQGLQQKKVTGL